MNTFRLSQRTVGFKANRYTKYYLHINCPCKLGGSSFVGTYGSEAEALYAVPVVNSVVAPSGHCPKNEPLVAEEKPKKARKANRKTRFVQGVVSAVNLPESYRAGRVVTSDGHEIEVSWNFGACIRLTVKDRQGNIYEMRRQFTASNAENIAKALWELMKEMSV